MFSFNRKVQLLTGLKSTMAIIRNLSTFNGDAKRQAMQDTAWADGLRGLAALFVVSSHIVLCLTRELVRPCCVENTDTPFLFQRPILRLVAAGQSWVAIFFILMGFVNSLKPIKLARSGEAESAASKLALSSFSRILRLVLPAALATVISWTACQLGFYSLASQSDAYWLYANTPMPSSTISFAFSDLQDALINTWMLGRNNIYDQPQWALIYLLQGSMMIILALLVTVNMTSTWRSISLFTFAVWSMDWSNKFGDPWLGLTVFLGILLAETSLSSLPGIIAPYSTIFSPPLLIFALILMSYPNMQPNNASWSSYLFSFGANYLAVSKPDSLERLLPSLGAILFVLTVVISPHLRFLLSRRPLLWLGKVSFAIYLLHGTVLRTVFAWSMFYGATKKEIRELGEDGYTWNSEWRYPVPGVARCVAATMLAGLVTLGMSHLWNCKVEPIVGIVTARIERLVGVRKDDDIGVLMLNEEKMILPVREEGVKLG